MNNINNGNLRKKTILTYLYFAYIISIWDVWRLELCSLKCNYYDDDKINCELHDELCIYDETTNLCSDLKCHKIKNESACLYSIACHWKYTSDESEGNCIDESCLELQAKDET